MPDALSPMHRTLIRQSFNAMEARSEKIAPTFLKRLGDFAPDAEALLPSETAALQGQISGVLKYTVSKINELESISGALGEFGARVTEGGIDASHYPLFKEALIATLSAIAPDAWSSPVEEAWREGIDAATKIMTSDAVSKAA